MRNFEISTDSTCDLYANEVKENELFFLPLTFTLTDKDGNVNEYKDEFSSPEQYVEYYEKLHSGLVSRTSMNNPAIHEEYFMSMAKAGVKEAIHFTISYGLCRTVDVAREAVAEVQKTYPDFHCLCVESNTTTLGQGMLVQIAIDMRNKGKTLEETFEYVENIKHKIQHFIIVDDLKSLVRGGRLSAAAGAVGSMLQVKPIIVFNKEGKLESYKKSMGLKHSICDIAREFASYTLNKDYPMIFIGHTGKTDSAEYLQGKLKELYNIDVPIRMIGPVIASHLGYGAVAYAFISNEERPI